MWIRTIVGVESDVLYMLLAEGPICCVGAIGLFIVILGLVLALSGPFRSEEASVEGEFGLVDVVPPFPSHSSELADAGPNSGSGKFSIRFSMVNAAMPWPFGGISHTVHPR